MKKNTTKKTLASLAIVGMALTMTPFNAFANTGVTTARLFGTDRVGTAVAVADAGWTSSDTAILAPSADANLVDALAAAPLAGKTAPILLTDNNTLTEATKAELLELGVTKVYVVGAISQTVVNQVNAMIGVTATVLKGSDRIATAVAIASKLTNPAGSFVVGYGALADALSVASYAAANNYSILVTNPDGSLPASEVAYKGANVNVIGGPSLVDDVVGATRYFGADRFDTNKAVLEAFTYKYDNVYVANGTDSHLVDSLVASSLAAKSGAPIVLADTNSAAAGAYVHAKLAANAVVTALGGKTVVFDQVIAQIAVETESEALAVGAINSADITGMGATITANATTLGLDLTDYALLKDTSLVHTALVSKNFVDKVAVKVAFDSAVASEKTAEAATTAEVVAVAAINSADTAGMGVAITANAMTLGLNLTDYTLLTDKTPVYSALVSKSFVNKIAVKAAFDTAVTSEKTTEAIAATAAAEAAAVGAINSASIAGMGAAITANATTLGLNLTDYTLLTGKTPVHAALVSKSFVNKVAVKGTFEAAVASEKTAEATAAAEVAAVLAINTATEVSMDATITTNATTLGLVLTDYNALSNSQKSSVFTTLAGKAFANKNAVKTAFDAAVATATAL